VVWDKSASIEFLKTGAGEGERARFELPPRPPASTSCARKADEKGKINPLFEVTVLDEAGRPRRARSGRCSACAGKDASAGGGFERRRYVLVAHSCARQIASIVAWGSRKSPREMSGWKQPEGRHQPRTSRPRPLARTEQNQARPVVTEAGPQGRANDTLGKPARCGTGRKPVLLGKPPQQGRG